MFVLVGAQQVEGMSLFAIKDTEDGKIDIVEQDKIVSFLRVGLTIEGVHPSADLSAFTYTTENFITNDNVNDTDEDEFDFEEDYEEDYDEDVDEDDDDEDYEEDFESEELEEEESYYYEDEDYYEEEPEDLEEEESTVSKLYSYLTPEQVKTLQMYYLWYSQNIFNVAQKDPTLSIKDVNKRVQKLAELDKLRNLGGLWHYAGFIDTGYDGGGYCTLGHKLRYMHLAWDVSVSDIETAFWGDDYTVDINRIIESNNCIIFGIKCITDFFEVDKECMGNLMRAQRESMKEMDYLCSLYEAGTVEEVRQGFELFDEVMEVLVKKCNRAKLIGDEPIIEYGLVNFYQKFKACGLLYPKSLVQQVRDGLVGWSEHKFIGCRSLSINKLQDSLFWICGKKVNPVFDFYKQSSTYFSDSRNIYTDFVCGLRQYIELFFYREICGTYKYDPASKLFKDEGGGSRQAKAWLRDRQCKVKYSFFDDAEYSLDYMNKVFDILKKFIDVTKNIRENIFYYDVSEQDGSYFVDKKNLPMHTQYLNSSIKDKLSPQIVKIYSNMKYGKLLPLWADFTDSDDGNTIESVDKMLSNLEGYFNGDYNNFVESQRVSIESRVNELNESNKKKVENYENNRVRELEKEKEESSQAPVDKTKIINTCLQALKNSDTLKRLNDANDFYVKVITTVRKTNNASDKQMYYLSKAYEVITGNKVNLAPEGKLLLAEHQEIALDIAKIQKEESKLRGVLGADAQKTLDIMSSILKYGAATPRQLKYVNKAKEALGIN